MTRTTTARLAGFTFLFYIAAGIASLVLARQPHVVNVLSVLTALCALVLGVTLFAITRGEDADLALLALTCRIIEAVPGGAEGVGAIFFAVGSTIFSWLLLCGRMIPAALAWLGVLASAALVLLLLSQRAGLFGGAYNWSSSITWLVWLPMLVFEVTFAVWLIVKGVAAPVATRAV
jgi:hypothetical protein